MEQFLRFDAGQLLQLVVIVGTIVAVFQAQRSDSKNQAGRLEKVEEELAKIRDVMVAVARQDERLNSMDQRLLAQGQRIDATATIINGRLEAINNIVAGHTGELNNLMRRAG